MSVHIVDEGPRRRNPHAPFVFLRHGCICRSPLDDGSDIDCAGLAAAPVRSAARVTVRGSRPLPILGQAPEVGGFSFFSSACPPSW